MVHHIERTTQFNQQASILFFPIDILTGDTVHRNVWTLFINKIIFKYSKVKHLVVRNDFSSEFYIKKTMNCDIMLSNYLKWSTNLSNENVFTISFPSILRKTIQYSKVYI